MRTNLGGKTMSNKFRKILLYVSVIVLLVSLSYIVFNKLDSFRDNQIIENLQETKKEEETNSEDRPKEPKTILPEYEKLYNENNDLYGWLKIEGTSIDYPVMHTPDNPNFYLNRNWQKEESELGSIFIDARTGDDTENTIIYGHRINNGSMFGSLGLYKEKEYYEGHKYIQFDTIYEKATYQIIAVSKAVIYYNNKPKDKYLFYEHVELNSPDEFNDYISWMKENSYYEIDNTAEYGDKIITLCTCDYWTQNARLLIVAKKIK